jgi:hypothetical protein
MQPSPSIRPAAYASVWTLGSSEAEDVGHVLDQDVSGSKLANDSEHLAPQNGLGMVEPRSLPCGRRALAREAAGDEVDPSSVSCSEVSDVCVLGGVGEPLGEHAASPGVGLADPCGLAEAGEHEPVVEEADACEARAMDHARLSRRAL